MEGTRNKPRCRPGLRRPIDVRRPSKEVGNRAGAADAAIVLVRYRALHISKPCSTTALGDCSRVVEHLRFGPDTKAPVAPRTF